MDERGFQPDCGLAFFTYGHYGSTFFDPMDGSAIEIAVCDECIRSASESGLVRSAHHPNPLNVHIQPIQRRKP